MAEKYLNELVKLKMDLKRYVESLEELKINSENYDSSKLENQIQQFIKTLNLIQMNVKRFGNELDTKSNNVSSLNVKVEQSDKDNKCFYNFIKEKSKDVSQLTSDEKDWISLHAYPDGKIRRLRFMELINRTIQATIEYESCREKHKANKDLIKSNQAQIHKLIEMKQKENPKSPSRKLDKSQSFSNVFETPKRYSQLSKMKENTTNTISVKKFNQIIKYSVEDLTQLKGDCETLFNEAYKNTDLKSNKSQKVNLSELKEKDRKILKKRLTDSLAKKKNSIKEQHVTNIDEKTLKHLKDLTKSMYLPYEIKNNTNKSSVNISTKPLNYDYQKLRQSQYFEFENQMDLLKINILSYIKNSKYSSEKTELSDDNKEINETEVFDKTESVIMTERMKSLFDQRVAEKSIKLSNQDVSKKNDDNPELQTMNHINVTKENNESTVKQINISETSEELNKASINKSTKPKLKDNKQNESIIKDISTDSENPYSKLKSKSITIDSDEVQFNVEDKSDLFEILPESNDELDVSSDDEQCPSKFYATNEPIIPTNLYEDRSTENDDSEISIVKDYEDLDKSFADSSAELLRFTTTKLKYYSKIPLSQLNKLGCIISCHGTGHPSIEQNSFICNIVSSDHLLPEIDLKDNYSSYIIQVKCRLKTPRDVDLENITYTLSLPIKNVNKVSCDVIIMKLDESEFKWEPLVTSSKSDTFIKYKSKHPPHGIYTSVSFVRKDNIVINQKGINMSCSSDSHVSVDIPENASRIPINASLQSYKITSEMWNELQNKYSKKELQNIVSSSSILYFKTKRKKLAKPGTLTFYLPERSFQYIHEQKEPTNDLRTENSASSVKSQENIKTLELNSFQKSLVLPLLTSFKNVNDIKVLNYNNEDNKWNILNGKDCQLNKQGAYVTTTFPVLLDTKFIIMRTKFGATNDHLLKAAKKINNALMYRTVCIGLFKSLFQSTQFIVLLALKSLFNVYSEYLIEHGFVHANEDESDLVTVELREYQEVTVRMNGNLVNDYMANDEKREIKMRFYSLFPNYISINAKVYNKLVQRAVSTYRGYVDILARKSQLIPTTLLEQSSYVLSASNLDLNHAPSQVSTQNSNLLAHFLLTVRKKNVTPEYFMFKKEHINKRYYRNCVALVKQMSYEIGDNWFEFGKSLGVGESRLNSIRYNFECFGNQKCAKQLLVYWMKGCRNFDRKMKLLKDKLGILDRQTIRAIDEIYNPRILRFGC